MYIRSRQKLLQNIRNLDRTGTSAQRKRRSTDYAYVRWHRMPPAGTVSRKNASVQNGWIFGDSLERSIRIIAKHDLRSAAGAQDAV